MTINPRRPRHTLIPLLITLLCTLGASAADTTATADTKKYIPQVHANLRAFYQLSTVTGESRFMVQNARVTAAGYVTDWLDYFAQIDLCANGAFKVWDVYATFKPLPGLKLMLGQSKAPFSTETARPPYTYIFATTNATFTPGNIRSVGLRFAYAIPRTHITTEGGIYNNSDIISHATWNTSLLYSLRASADLPCGLRPSLGFMSRRPGGNTGTRINQYDATLGFKTGRLFIEGEYLYRLYTGDTHRPTSAYSFMADYTIPVRARMADRISLQGRFDGMTDYWSGLHNSDGTIINTSESYRRITLGITASRRIALVECNFLINFEQYFYGHGCPDPSPAANNMLIAGVNIRI